MKITAGKKRNSIRNYFHNTDWRRASPKQIYFYVKMFDDAELSHACVHYYLRFRREFDARHIINKDALDCSRILDMLTHEVILRRAKRSHLDKNQLKKKYSTLEAELYTFLRSEEKLRSYGGTSLGH